MDMMSTDFDGIDYNLMFSKLIDFYVEQNNKNIIRRRKKTTEQKTILEKLEKKIEKKLENIYKEQIKTMWDYLDKFEKRENYYNEKIFEMQRIEIEQLNKLVKTMSENIEILLSNDGTFNENFQIFSSLLKIHCRNLKEYLERNIKSTDDVLCNHRDIIQQSFKDLISNINLLWVTPVKTN
jgi:hypothetical protein